MKTILTNEDVKNIVEKAFEENSEKIVLVQEDSNERKEVELADFLNVKFYAWKERLSSIDDFDNIENPQTSYVDAWIKSLNFSLNEAYALVEIDKEDNVTSNDIDSATISGKITFLIQDDKIEHLDYYMKKIKNAYLGNPQQITNKWQEDLTAYFVFGNLLTDEEPVTTFNGECIIATSNFRIVYMNKAETYSDTKISLSLDGENFHQVPLIKYTWQVIFTNNPVPQTNRPDITGVITSGVSLVKTFTYYNFNTEFFKQLDRLFWKFGAKTFNGVNQDVMNINVPIYVKIQEGEDTYTYVDIIDNMQKSYNNNDFTICSISLKSNGRLQN